MGRENRNGAIIAHHLVVSGYGHWLPNDLRGSGSTEVRMGKLKDLGPIHFGRKREQPSRGELREFFEEAEGRLEHPVLWFGDEERRVIGGAIGSVVSRRRYTVWACAALRDHVHLCVRVHRDDYETMWRVVTEEASNALQEVRADWKGRPIWADRPYSVYLKTVADVWRVVRYIEGNPKKHGLGEQAWGFVKEYDEWPFHKRNGRSH